MRAIVKGDRDFAVISAASILAKTARDAMLDELDGRFPAYGFAHNRGYGTPEHLAALARPDRARRIAGASGRSRNRCWVSETDQAVLLVVAGTTTGASGELHCGQSCGRSRLTVSSDGR